MSASTSSSNALPAIDARGVKLQLPSFISVGRDPDLICRPACARCGLERVPAPAYFLSCAVTSLLERTGAPSMNQALELHSRPTFEGLRSAASISSSVVCLTCALTLVGTAAARPASSRTFECPACKEHHPAPDGLVVSSRFDAYVSHLQFIEDAKSSDAWLVPEVVGRQALCAVFERVVAMQEASERVGDGPPEPNATRSTSSKAKVAGGLPPPAPDEKVAPRTSESPRVRNPDAEESSGPGSGAAPPAEASASASASASATTATTATTAVDRKQKGKQAAVAPSDGPATAQPAAEAAPAEDKVAEERTKPQLRKRPPPEEISKTPPSAEPHASGPAAPPAKRQRSKWGAGRTARLPYESDKLVKVLYTAYSCPVDSKEDPSPEGATSASESDREGSPAAPAAGPSTAKEAASEEGAGGSDGDADGSRAGSPDPREHELADAWNKAYTAAAGGEVGALPATAGEGSTDDGSASPTEVDPESLAAYELGLCAGVDPSLVGRRLDGNAEARAELLARVQHAGRERIRALLLIAAATLGAYQKYRDQHGNNRKLWAHWRKQHVFLKYDSILEAIGFRLEINSLKVELYSDLRYLAETVRRFPGLAKICGAGISPVDFVSTVPLLRTADAEGAKRVAARVVDEVRRAVGYQFDESVLALTGADGDSNSAAAKNEENKAAGESEDGGDRE
eukprot:tig00020553_g10530.t1